MPPDVNADHWSLQAAAAHLNQSAADVSHAHLHGRLQQSSQGVQVFRPRCPAIGLHSLAIWNLSPRGVVYTIVGILTPPTCCKTGGGCGVGSGVGNGVGNGDGNGVGNGVGKSWTWASTMAPTSRPRFLFEPNFAKKCPNQQPTIRVMHNAMNNVTHNNLVKSCSSFSVLTAAAADREPNAEAMRVPVPDVHDNLCHLLPWRHPTSGNKTSSSDNTSALLMLVVPAPFTVAGVSDTGLYDLEMPRDHHVDPP